MKKKNLIHEITVPLFDCVRFIVSRCVINSLIIRVKTKPKALIGAAEISLLRRWQSHGSNDWRMSLSRRNEGGYLIKKARAMNTGGSLGWQMGKREVGVVREDILPLWAIVLQAFTKPSSRCLISDLSSIISPSSLPIYIQPPSMAMSFLNLNKN